MEAGGQGQGRPGAGGQVWRSAEECMDQVWVELGS